MFDFATASARLKQITGIGTEPVAGFLLGRPGLNAGISHRRLGRRQLTLGQPVCLGLGSPDVLRHPDRNPDSSRPHWVRDGKGPALTLLLAGPALSLPSMIVITRMIGAKRAFTYIVLVVILSTMVGMLYGALL